MIYSRSLQKKGNCIEKQMNVSRNRTVGTKRCIKKLLEKEESNAKAIHIMHSSYVQLYLFYPVDNRRPCMRMFLQYSEVCEHRIPFRTKLIIPEEVSDQLWSCILEDSSATVHCRPSLMNNMHCQVLMCTVFKQLGMQLGVIERKTRIPTRSRKWEGSQKFAIILKYEKYNIH